MTPAINALKKGKVPYTVHKYSHDPAHESYGNEAAEKLDLQTERVFKTLVIQLDNGKLAVAIIPVSSMLSMKLIAKAAEAKKAIMAEKNLVEKTTGYVLGGVSPIGQKKRLPTFIDSSAQSFSTIFVSGGRRGVEIELSPFDLSRFLNSLFAEICQ